MYGICITCNTGFIKQLGACLLKVCTDENYDSTKHICKECPVNSDYLMGNCNPSLITLASPCKLYSSDGCLACAVGFVSVVVGTYQQCKQLPIKNCIDGDVASRICTGCVFGTVLINNKCLTKVNNCDTYNSDTNTC